MQKEQVYTKENRLNDMVLKYYLLHWKKENNSIYEIKIEKWKKENLIEWEETGGFTNDKNLGIAFLNRLHRNQITPMCLLEVTDDCFYDTI